MAQDVGSTRKTRHINRYFCGSIRRSHQPASNDDVAHRKLRLSNAPKSSSEGLPSSREARR